MPTDCEWSNHEPGWLLPPETSVSPSKWPSWPLALQGAKGQVTFSGILAAHLLVRFGHPPSNGHPRRMNSRVG